MKAWLRELRGRLFPGCDEGLDVTLVVWAIHEGREAAREIDRYLMGATDPL